MIAAVATFGTTHAITVLNAGFEDPDIADGEWITNQTVEYDWQPGYYDVAADPEEWIRDDTTDSGGICNPDASMGYPSGTAYAGENAGWAASGAGIDIGLVQVMNENLQAGMEYVPEVQVGNSL